MTGVFSFSCSDGVDDGDFSEFWSRDDEASGSEDAISDSDGMSFSQEASICFRGGNLWGGRWFLM